VHHINIAVPFLALSLLAGPTGALAQQVSPAAGSAQVPGTPAAAAQLPRLVKFSGAAKDAIGKPMSNLTGITFALYQDQQGGTALWTENQNVQPDAAGHYTVWLGATRNDGVPVELFATGQARWLGVQVEGQPEQTRVLLAAVPYALKAADAETLGGLPPSAFALAGTANHGLLTESPAGSGKPVQPTAATTPDQTGSGTANYIAMWTGTTALGNSLLYQAASGNVGLGTTAATAKLEAVTGKAGGTAVLGYAASTTGANFGVTGKTLSSTGTGVLGEAMAASGVSYGVYGSTSSPAGNGVNGVNTAASGLAIGVNGQSASPAGAGVNGVNTATSGGNGGAFTSSATSGWAAGVSGISNSPAGTGVYGQNSATSGGFAVQANANATSGFAVGVFGGTNSPAGAGVDGTNNAVSGGNGVMGISNAAAGGNGVYGQSVSANGTGVYGYNSATSGGALGVSGSTASPGGAGVFGSNTATSGGNGVQGQITSAGGNGVFGSNMATSGFAVGVNGSTASPGGDGVYGQNNATSGGIGVYGISNATSGYASGVFGQSASPNGNGVNGNATATSGTASGVYASTASPNGNGVFAINNATSGYGDGVYATSASPTGYGVQGTDSAGGTGVQGGSTNGVAVSGINATCNSQGACTPVAGTAGQFITGTGGTILQGLSGPAYAQVFYVDSSGNGYFAGNLNVTGQVTKGSGSFKIDHPLDPANKYLSHSFVESPDMMDVYNGMARLDAKGEAWVHLPDYFEALNGDFRYQLTAVGASAPRLYVAREVSQNRFKIAGGRPGGRVSWQVTGIRRDAYANAHRIPVTEDKPAAEQGTYLHPDVYGRRQNRELSAGSR
jgi:hypothetical protein